MNNRSSGKGVEVEKPRRLEEETAIYLAGLEPQLEDAENNENIGLLIDNVLDEIKQRTASAASDRRTNFVIEKLCNFASISQLVEIIKRCSPYVLFLSQNRHSSHVVQSIIARMCRLLRAGETYDIDLDNLESVILTFADPILSNFSWMAGEISGSHVLRSVMCLLSGLPLISERKSSSSKHQHAVALSEPLEKLLVPDHFYIDSKLCFQVPHAFYNALYNSVEKSLLGQTDSEGASTGSASSFSHNLQLMISDTSCCAALVILLRILYAPNLIDGGTELAEQIASCALEWTSSSQGTDVGADVFYAMGGDKSGSYFLEAVIECSNVSFLIDLVQRSLVARSSHTIQEFVEDNVANFIIQSVLKRLTSIFNISNKRESPVPECDQLVQVSDTVLSKLLKKDLFSYLVQCRGGVVLWMLQLGKSKSFRKKNVMDESPCTGDIIARQLLSQWTACSIDNVEDETFLNALDAYMIRRFEVASLTEKKGETNKNKKSSDAPVSNKPNAAALLVARLLGAVLSLDGSEMAGVVCRMICRLPHNTLMSIACSGPMSRSILDIFFESKSNGRERSIFLTSFLMPNLSTVCSHPIAHHTLRKCFESASSIDKERVAEALIAPSLYDSLAHSREGKAVIRFSQCDLYARNISEWKALIVRQKKAQAMLDELENVTTAISKTQKSDVLFQKPNSESQQVVNVAHSEKNSFDDNSPAEISAPSGRKRKRKRTSSKKEEDIDNDDVAQSNDAIEDIFNDQKDTSNSASEVIRKQSNDSQNQSDLVVESSEKKRKKKKSNQKYSKDFHHKSSKNNAEKADFQKIKMLNSAKMMSIKKLTENL